MKTSIFVLLACLAVILMSCHKDGPVHPPDVPPSQVPLTGTWGGTRGDIVLSLYLTEQSTAIAGTGQLILDVPFPITVLGSHAQDSVSLRLRSDRFGDATFAGVLQGDRFVVGVLEGFGSPSMSYDFVKFSDRLFKR